MTGVAHEPAVQRKFLLVLKVLELPFPGRILDCNHRPNPVPRKLLYAKTVF
jgi:hypothetical protein